MTFSLSSFGTYDKQCLVCEGGRKMWVKLSNGNVNVRHGVTWMVKTIIVTFRWSGAMGIWYNLTQPMSIWFFWITCWNQPTYLESSKHKCDVSERQLCHMWGGIGICEGLSRNHVWVNTLECQASRIPQFNWECDAPRPFQIGITPLPIWQASQHLTCFTSYGWPNDHPHTH